MIYDTKEAFLAIGVEPVTPTPNLVHTDCDICLRPIAMSPATTEPQQYTDPLNQLSPAASLPSENSTFHPGLRILSCRHIHGAVCLQAWLEIGNTCPTCRRILFTPPPEQPITQEDVNWVVQSLIRYFDEDQIYLALMRELSRYMSGEDVRIKLIRSMEALENAEREIRETEDMTYAMDEMDFSDQGESEEYDEEYDEEENETTFYEEGNEMTFYEEGNEAVFYEGENGAIIYGLLPLLDEDMDVGAEWDDEDEWTDTDNEDTLVEHGVAGW